MNKKDFTLLFGVGFTGDLNYCKTFKINNNRQANKTNCFGIYYVGFNYGLSKRFSVSFSAQAYQLRSKYQQELSLMGGGTVVANVIENRTFASFPFRLHWQWLNKKRITISSNIGIDASLIAHKSSHDQMNAALDSISVSGTNNNSLSGSDMRVSLLRFPTWNPEDVNGYPILNGSLLDIRFRLSNKVGLFLIGPSMNISFIRAGLSFKLVQNNGYSISNQF